MTVRLTKIIATLGPASGTKKNIKELVKTGVNLFRLNLSHGDHEVVRQWISWIREAEKELKTFVGILLDLQGPKIRVGKFKDGSIQLHRGREMVFTTERVMGTESLVPIQYGSFHKDVKPGDQVFLNDGNLCVEVKKVSGKRVTGVVKAGGPLSDHKGVNLPDSSLTTSPLTPKDKKDLQFGLQEGVDFVALSFVGRAKDIDQLRRLIRASGGDAEIIAKIERKQAVENLEEIVAATDGVMVARGDLGVEIPFADVPVVQQKILKACAQESKPVIVATQMLESMIVNPRPTRAEVSDVANSVMCHADAVMLSGETAVGKHPTAAVKVMVETAIKTETFQRQGPRIMRWHESDRENTSIARGITYSANQLVELLQARAVIVFTLSGGTARMMASQSPMVPMFVFTSSLASARRLTLLRGAIPFLMEKRKDFLEDMGALFRILKKQRLVKKGNRVVITAGLPFHIPNRANVVRVENIP
ncbi:MAG: pyruvate kinase [Nitrospinaceae bacterium]|nr:MAG: pyruvate kinase [Nitrospinaceae bacterium]